MNFVPGARWSESAVGTNAPGTAVAVDRPVQVFAAEHFIRRVQPWTCAAAPVHDPRTGRVLGAVDITGGNGLAHPHSLGFVQAVARAAESQLALLAPEQTSVDGPELTALGRDEAQLCVHGRKMRLSRRRQRDPGAAGPASRGADRGRAAVRAVRGRVGAAGDVAGRTGATAQAVGAGPARLASLPAHVAGRVRCGDRRAAVGSGLGDGGGDGVHGTVAARFAGAAWWSGSGPASRTASVRR